MDVAALNVGTKTVKAARYAMPPHTGDVDEELQIACAVAGCLSARPTSQRNESVPPCQWSYGKALSESRGSELDDSGLGERPRRDSISSMCRTAASSVSGFRLIESMPASIRNSVISG
jgi:hypothetical protein